MKYAHPGLRDQLAAHYVLGTLGGRARSRFQRLLAYDVSLRRLVNEWEERLMPLAQGVPAVSPPSRVWRRIEARIHGDKQRSRVSRSFGWWRGLAIFSSMAALVLAIALVARAPLEQPVSTVAVLTDEKAQPAMIVAWARPNEREQWYLRVKMLTEPQVPSGKALELWMLPGGKAAPISLGVIKRERAQTIALKSAASSVLPGVWGMAISVEPEGGSPTGAPTGPVILSGPCVKLI